MAKKVDTVFVEIRAAMGKLRQDFMEAKRLTKDFKRGFGKFGGLPKGLINIPLGPVIALFKKLASVIGGIFVRSLKLAVKWVKRLTIALGVGLIAAVGLGIKRAADISLQMKTFAIVFGNQARLFEQFVQDFSRAINRFSGDVRATGISFQSLFKGLGVGEQDASELSKTLTRLSFDFAAFEPRIRNSEEAMQRFVSAISGSPEVLDRFGINLKEVALNQELLNQGVVDGVQAASQQQKAIARLSLILKGAEKIGFLGFAAQSIQDFRNALRAVTASTKELLVAVGDVFVQGEEGVNAVLGVSRALRIAADILKRNADAIRGFLLGLFETTSAGIQRVFASDRFAQILGVFAELPGLVRPAIDFLVEAAMEFKRIITEAIEDIKALPKQLKLEGTKEVEKAKAFGLSGAGIVPTNFLLKRLQTNAEFFGLGKLGVAARAAQLGLGIQQGRAGQAITAAEEFRLGRETKPFQIQGPPEPTRFDRFLEESQRRGREIIERVSKAFGESGEAVDRDIDALRDKFSEFPDLSELIAQLISGAGAPGDLAKNLTQGLQTVIGQAKIGQDPVEKNTSDTVDRLDRMIDIQEQILTQSNLGGVLT